MPYTVERRDGKFRIIHAAGPNKGDIAMNAGGTPMDGGGHATRSEAEAQARAVEFHEHKNYQGRYGVEYR